MNRIAGFILAALIFGAASVQAAEKADGGAMYQAAEELEWYKDGVMKDIDDLYQKAAKAGSSHAWLASMRNRIAEAEAEAQNKLAEELCPQAKKIIKDWAKTDDADALFHMARYYADGICENRDAKKAREYLIQSAEAGNPKAQYYLGRSLRKKDPKSAFEWISKSAASGFPQAIASEGACYLQGIGVEKNEKKGMQLIEQAVASGNSNTIYDVAVWQLQGTEGMKKNEGEAKKLLEKLVKRGYEPAKGPLADISAKK